MMMCSLKWGVFVFFGLWQTVALIFTILLVPETRGVPIEKASPQISICFQEAHAWCLSNVLGTLTYFHGVKCLCFGPPSRMVKTDCLYVRDPECKTQCPRECFFGKSGVKYVLVLDEVAPMH